MLTFADVINKACNDLMHVQVTYAVTYADVCWRMLTYADVCGRMQEREAVLALDMQKMRSEFEAKDLATKKMHYAEKEVLGD